MANASDQGAPRVRGRQGHDRKKVMSDLSRTHPTSRSFRRLVLRAGKPVEIDEAPDRETR